jgi:hypothetical protein
VGVGPRATWPIGTIVPLYRPHATEITCKLRIIALANAQLETTVGGGYPAVYDSGAKWAMFADYPFLAR